MAEAVKRSKLEVSMRWGRWLLRFCAYIALIFYAWYIMVSRIPTWSWERRGTAKPWWEKWRSENSIKYHMDASDNQNLVDGGDVLSILMWWFPLLVAAVCAYAAASIPLSGGSSTCHSPPSLRSVHRYFASQVYPRNFWLSWCSGLSLGELLGVALWVAAHCTGFWNFLEYYRLGATYRSAIGFRSEVPRSVTRLDWIALTFGWLSFIDFAFLFLPISHNSFLAALTGLPYAALIRYHRWIGHSAMWMIALHGILYYFYWIADPYVNFWEQLLDFGKNQRINGLAGSIALLFGVALWITSFNFVRRQYFEVFYKTHIVGFLGFVTFGIIHYPGMWSIFVPGLALYAADYITRIVQGSNVSTVQAAYVSDNDQVAVMELPANEGFSKCPIQDLFMLFPTISRWQWHPFTIMDRKAGSNGRPGTVTVATKSYGKWTEKVMQQLRHQCPVPVRALGAFDGFSVQELAGYDHLLLIGGGIGVTPMVALLREIKQLRENVDSIVSCLHKVQFVWVARSAAELSIIPEDVVVMARSEPWLSLSLHYTGKEPLQPTKDIKVVKLESDLDSNSTRSPAGPCPAMIVDNTYNFSYASPLFWNMARPLQPYGPLLSLVTALVAFIGAFLGLVIALSSYLEWTQKYFTTDKYWKHGMTVLVCITVQTIGLPMSLVVLPRQYLLGKKDACQVAASPSSIAHAEIQDNGTATYPESGASVDIVSGRPDLQVVLDELLVNEKAKEVCIYCAGPEAMIKKTALMAWNLQREDRSLRVDFKKYAYEL